MKKLFLALALLGGASAVQAADLAETFKALCALPGVKTEKYNEETTLSGIVLTNPQTAVIGDERGSAGIDAVMEQVMPIIDNITDAEKILSASNAMNYLAVYAAPADASGEKVTMLVVHEDNFEGTTMMSLSTETALYAQCVAGSNVYMDWTGLVVKPMPEAFYRYLLTPRR